MTDVNEALSGGKGEFAAGLALGTDTISQNQVVTFTPYIRTLLPLDGFAFWVRADLLSPSALFNTTAFNSIVFGATPQIKTPAVIENVKGSVHYSTENRQDLDEGFAVNTVVFTSEQDLDELNQIAPDVIYIAELDGIRFWFSSRNMYYRQSGLSHYRGQAVYPSMESQVIDFPEALDLRNVVVSNSLPAWLTLNKFCPMWPSFLVPDNIVPPWCSVHIPPESTRALQMAPYIDPSNGSRWQLAAETVRLTTYGLRNFQVMDLLDYIFSYMTNAGVLGLMNSPVPRDEKRTQSELNVIAMKKTIEFEVSYNQLAIRDVGLQYIRSAFLDLIPA